MPRTVRLATLAVMGLLLAANACTDMIVPPDTAKARQLLGNVAIADEGRASSLDDALSAINARAPGFGGMYINEQDELVLVLTRDANVAVARAAVSTVLGGMPGKEGAAIRTVSGTYEINELRTWRRLYERSGDYSKIVLSDLDERQNRIVFGVLDMSSASAIKASLIGLGIPVEAVIVKHTSLPIKLTTLQDSVLPIIGGLQFWSRIPNQQSKPCSTGFNAKLTGDGSNLYMITNAHCTLTFAAVDGDSLYAPSYIPFWRQALGHETTDPAFSAIPGCPSGRVCRMADAAAFRYTNSASGTLGDLARTLFYTIHSSGITLVRDSNMVLSGPVRDSLLLSGQWIQKVGRTTGWSHGRIDQTCFTATAFTGKDLLCQYNAWNANAVSPDSLFVNAGDSGSPAFITNNHQEYSEGVYWLAGLLWGSSYSATPGDPYGKRTFFFSPISGVKTDLGISQIAVNECEPTASFNACR